MIRILNAGLLLIWFNLCALGFFCLGALSPAFAGQFVIEPGQELRARQLVDLDNPKLCEGVTIARVAVTSDAVIVTLRSVDGVHQAALRAPGDKRDEGIVTQAGILVIDPEAPTCVTPALMGRLKSSTARLAWRRLAIARDASLAEADSARLSDRLTQRLRASRVAPDGGHRPGSTELDLLKAQHARGEIGGAQRALSQVLCGASFPPPGALSLWIKWGGLWPEPSPRCMAWQTLSTRDAGQLDSHPMAPWSDEPLLLAEVASIHAEAGRAELAAALLSQALMADVHEPEVHALASSWGWTEAPSSERGASLWSRSSWVLFAVLICLLIAWWLVGGARSRRDTLLLAIASLGVVGMIAALSSESEGERPSKPSLSSAWLELGRGSVCQVSPPAIGPSLWQARVRCPDGEIGAVVTGSLSDEGHSQTAHHTLHVIPLDGRTRGPIMESWLHGVRAELRVLEEAGERLRGQGDILLARPAPTGMLERIMGRLDFEREQHRLVGGLMPLVLVCLLILFGQALITLYGTTDSRRLLLVVFVIGGAAHLMAPARMVMVYAGYMQTDQLVEWLPLRYGAGANWLYGPFLNWIGEDHATVQLVNRLYGLIGTVFMAALAIMFKPTSRSVGLITLSFIALSPLMWRDHASESILVGGWCLLAASLFGLASAVRGEVSRGVLAVPLGLIAVMTRPEYGLALVLILAGLLLGLRPRWRARQWTAVGLCVFALSLVGWVHQTFIAERLEMLTSTGALPGYEGLGARALNDFFGFGGLSVVVEYGPAFLLLPLFVGLVLSPTRWLCIGLMALSFAWMALTRVDLPPVSIPRVHAPPWTFLALAGALGLDALLDRLQQDARRGAHRFVVIASVIAWSASAVVSYETLYAPTNADEEERLLRASDRELPSNARCIATIAPDDPPPPGKTHRFFPAYLFHTEDAPVQLFSLSGYIHDDTQCPDGAYALLGMRCYMALREGQTEGPPPSGEVMVEGCNDFLRRWRLESTIAWRASNRGDVSFPMYPQSDELQIGLYKILGPAP